MPPTLTRQPWAALLLLFVPLGQACAGQALPPTSAEGPEVAPVPATPVVASNPPPGQLPKSVRPTHYTIALSVDPDADRFMGRVRIAIDLDQSQELIWLHGEDLNVLQANAYASGATIPAKWQATSVEGVAAFVPERPLPAGQAVLEIDYDAPFNRQLRGLYKVVNDGRAYAFTQFESISARNAFPCFDEPAFKTPFDVSIIASDKHRVIGNTLETSREALGPGWVKTTFSTTENLPTYLLAWAVGPLDVVEHAPIGPTPARARPIPLRGVAAHGKGPLLRLALEGTAPMLQSLEKYFGIGYPYDKLDLIAVPDFAAGGMENAGAITFKEWLLLLDPETADERQRRAYASVMAHELAHQWFGDLVTMPWWNDIWLNEAFATWMGTRTVSELYPEFDAPTSFLDSVHTAMKMDSLVNARHIRQPIESNHDIQNAFDSITYRKGGGVLSMFERFLGPETFRRGIQSYLHAHRHATATSTDLLSALDGVTGKAVSASFRTFLEQPGVPLVEGTLECNGNSAALKVQQGRYLPFGSTGAAPQTWSIPVCVRHSLRGKTHETCQLVDTPSANVALDSPGCPDWVLPNADGAGYYRWLLDPETLKKLAERGFKDLSARERLSFADSLVAGFDAGRLTTQQVFPHLAALASDGDRTVAEAPMKLLEFTHNYLVDGADRKRVAAFASKLYARTFQKLGFVGRADERGETKLLRLSVLKFLTGVVRDPNAILQAEQQAKAFLAAKPGARSTLSRELVPAVLGALVRHGSAAEFDTVLTRFTSTQNPMLRNVYLGALGEAEQPEQLRRALELALDERVRVSEMTTTLRQALSSPETRDPAWAWLKQNFVAVKKRMSVKGAGMLPWLAAGFCSEQTAREVEDLFRPHVEDLVGGPRNLRGVTEAIRLCAARIQVQGPDATAFFKAAR